jgi:putative salt-induced outer membrane protein YdiY
MSDLNRGPEMPAKVSFQIVLVMCLAVLSLFAPGKPALAELDDSSLYTDRIHLRNGDVITGNIKELDRGKLRFKTRTMDTVFINWVNIESIDSDKYLRVERVDGTFNYGVIQQSDLSDGLVIEDHGREIEVPILSVSTIQPIRVRQSFWRQLEGEFSAGIDFKTASDILLINLSSNIRFSAGIDFKTASDILLINLSSNIRFRKEKYEVAVEANWNETSRTEDNNSSSADLVGDYTKFLSDRWFWKASTGFETNEELGLDLRTLVAGSAGRYLIQNPTLRLEMNAGLAGNWERRQDGTTTSAEGVIRSSLEIFKHTIPVTRLSASISVFPGITESGRLRVNSNVSLRNEIVRSVFWDLTFFSRFDNRPPEGASQEDYGIVTSIGASF